MASIRSIFDHQHNNHHHFFIFILTTICFLYQHHLNNVIECLPSSSLNDRQQQQQISSSSSINGIESNKIDQQQNSKISSSPSEIPNFSNLKINKYYDTLVDYDELKNGQKSNVLILNDYDDDDNDNDENIINDNNVNNNFSKNLLFMKQRQNSNPMNDLNNVDNYNHQRQTLFKDHQLNWLPLIKQSKQSSSIYKHSIDQQPHHQQKQQQLQHLPLIISDNDDDNIANREFYRPSNHQYISSNVIHSNSNNNHPLRKHPLLLSSGI